MNGFADETAILCIASLLAIAKRSIVTECIVGKVRDVACFWVAKIDSAINTVIQHERFTDHTPQVR